MRKRNTSWQNVNKWYGKKVGETGHYFHDQVIIPKLTALMELDEESKVLDIACGEGVLSRTLPMFKQYYGIDLARDLIAQAKEKNTKSNVIFEVRDAGKKFKLNSNQFTHAVIVLALQNIENYDVVLNNAKEHLIEGGKLFIVLNHPYFRIPKSSAWEIDPDTGYQSRRIFRYMSEHKIKIDMTPGSIASKEFTYSFHRSLQDYVGSLRLNGFVVSDILEWTSDKRSEGKFAQAENFARDEFPMFMYIEAIKLTSK